MAKIIPARTIKDDRETLVGIKTLEDYAPVNQEFSVAALSQMDEQLTQISEDRLRAWKAYEALTAMEAQIKQRFHAAIVGARRSVLAQYDGNAQAIRAVGLTRVIDRKRPARRAAPKKTNPETK